MNPYLLFLAALAAYLAPTLIAVARRHPMTVVVAVVNGLLGPSVIGWLWALGVALDPTLKPRA